MGDIKEICEKYNIKNYTINDDGTVDVAGHVDISDRGLTSIPLKFGDVSGTFNCGMNKLTSLEGSPTIVGINFICFHNNLTSLEGCPRSVGNAFYCGYNDITDLYGVSDDIRVRLYCTETPLSHLVGSNLDIDFIRAFNTFRVVKDKTVYLKRFKYLMKIFNKDYFIADIRKHYTIKD